MKILILDNSVQPQVRRPVENWRRYLRFPFEAFHIPSGEWPTDITLYTHVIVTGSAASIEEPIPWSIKEGDLIKRLVDAGKVILGSCYGHQLIARTLFGTSTTGRSSTPEIGWYRVDIVRDDDLLGRAGTSHYTCQLHFDEVKKVPPDRALVPASSPLCPIQAFRLKGKPVWGIQAHPEVTVDEAMEIMKRNAASDSDHAPYFAEALKMPPRDTNWITPIMDAFHKILPVTETI